MTRLNGSMLCALTALWRHFDGGGKERVEMRIDLKCGSDEVFVMSSFYSLCVLVVISKLVAVDFWVEEEGSAFEC